MVCLSGCTIPGLPSQQHPVCSWASQPPVDADRVCSQTFSTLTSLVAGERRGDNGTVYKLVSSPVIARRIINFGAEQRANRVTNLHVVPDLTLAITPRGYVGAGFYILGKGRKGQVNAPQTIYLKLRHGRAVVVGDQPNQDW